MVRSVTENKEMRQNPELLEVFWNNGKMKLDHHVYLAKNGSFLLVCWFCFCFFSLTETLVRASVLQIMENLQSHETINYLESNIQLNSGIKSSKYMTYLFSDVVCFTTIKAFEDRLSLLLISVFQYLFKQQVGKMKENGKQQKLLLSLQLSYLFIHIFFSKLAYKLKKKKLNIQQQQKIS